VIFAAELGAVVFVILPVVIGRRRVDDRHDRIEHGEEIARRCVQLWHFGVLSRQHLRVGGRAMNAFNVHGIDTVGDVALLAGRPALEVNPRSVAAPCIIDPQGFTLELRLDVLFYQQRFELGIPRSRVLSSGRCGRRQGKGEERTDQQRHAKHASSPRMHPFNQLLSRNSCQAGSSEKFVERSKWRGVVGVEGVPQMSARRG
jgi:hypothetical protein